MDLQTLENEVLCSERACIEWLIGFGIFTLSDYSCRGVGGRGCRGTMRREYRKLRSGVCSGSWKCREKDCRTRRSFRSTNKFFSYTSTNRVGNSRLRLTTIIRVVYLWLHTQATLTQMCTMTGLSRPTVNDWLYYCRELCGVVLNNSAKLVGTDDQPVQVDESYHVGRRKNHRGRLNLGDKSSSEDDDSSIVSSESSKDCHRGPWVFGVYQDNSNVRFRIVNDRKADTLIGVIREWVEEGSTIISDEWRAYARLHEAGYKHCTVCHKDEFVNKQTGFHTQAIERAWVETKAYLKRARGGGPLLQSHLNEISWRKVRHNHPRGLLAAFFEDVSTYYSTQ